MLVATFLNSIHATSSKGIRSLPEYPLDASNKPGRGDYALPRYRSVVLIEEYCTTDRYDYEYYRPVDLGLQYSNPEREVVKKRTLHSEPERSSHIDPLPPLSTVFIYHNALYKQLYPGVRYYILLIRILPVISEMCTHYRYGRAVSSILCTAVLVY